MIYNRKIQNPPNKGNDGCEITVATNDFGSHLNIYFNEDYAQLSPTAARELRDVLLEAYPLSTPEASPSSGRVTVRVPEGVHVELVMEER